ncbi:hypothetical protein C8034_v007861 [Colletotrichum sidae]|uniref:Nephrocystin 3-like N-terminal domain-containing protein n=1 Tax=Colletotrichum sidae TaxID=1347389 RepID=A0A4R8T342_9PEZI|nr:hypothetical protein C8034_v007861 [Colletotrichum sidae]
MSSASQTLAAGVSGHANTQEPFENELQRFKSELKSKEKDYFKFTTKEEFVRELDVLQTKLHAGRRQQNMTKLQGFIEAMMQFGKVIDVFCQTSEVVAFVWKNNFAAIGRSLLLQLLEHSPDLLPFFFEKYKTSTEATLTTVSDLEELLEIAIKNLPSVYIILDGIDECPRDQRKSITLWFRRLVEKLQPKDSDRIRCLFVSQDDGFARKDFSGVSSLKIQSKDNESDIREFSAAWASRIQQKFDLAGDRTQEIAKQIPESCNGMFLLAKLICENLLDQSTVEDLEYELTPNTFPKEINEAA